MLKIENLEFSYTENPFIKNFTLDIEQGDFLMLIGRNGSGKSTILKLILGIEKKKSGKIKLDNLTIDEDPYYLRKHIGLVFQNPDEQIVSHNVENELAFSMENYGIPREIMKEKIVKVLNLVNLSDKKNYKIEELSGGEKQRLCIASALVLDPKLIILDEPTSMLDSKNRQLIMNILKKINEKGVTILIVSHYLKELEFCKNVISLENGEINFQGDKWDFISYLITTDSSNFSLPVNFQFIKEIYKKTGVNFSHNIFSIEKVGDKIWELL